MSRLLFGGPNKKPSAFGRLPRRAHPFSRDSVLEGLPASENREHDPCGRILGGRDKTHVQGKGQKVTEDDGIEANWPLRIRSTPSGRGHADRVCEIPAALPHSPRRKRMSRRTRPGWTIGAKPLPFGGDLRRKARFSSGPRGSRRPHDRSSCARPQIPVVSKFCGNVSVDRRPLNF